MKIDGGAAETLRDRRFDNFKPRQRPWTFETGVDASYPSGEEAIYPPKAIQRNKDGSGIYVDFNLWPEDGDDEGLVSVRVPGRDTLFYVPIPWADPLIQKAQDNKRLQTEVNALVALEAIPTVVFTPVLYLMLNGTPRGVTQEPAEFPPVISTIDLMHCYHLVETLFTTNTEDQDAKRIKSARTQFGAALKKLKASVKAVLNDLPNGDEYAKALFEWVREHDGDPNSLASMSGDKEILTLIARIYISYQINYIHALEVYMVRLLLPNVNPEALDVRYFTCSALPAAHPQGLFNELIHNIEQESLIEESLVLLRQRAAQFNVKITPRELTLEPRVCGAPEHFFRLLFLILTH